MRELKSGRRVAKKPRNVTKFGRYQTDCTWWRGGVLGLCTTGNESVDRLGGRHGKVAEEGSTCNISPL